MGRTSERTCRDFVVCTIACTLSLGFERDYISAFGFVVFLFLFFVASFALWDNPLATLVSFCPRRFQFSFLHSCLSPALQVRGGFGAWKPDTPLPFMPATPNPRVASLLHPSLLLPLLALPFSRSGALGTREVVSGISLQRMSVLFHPHIHTSPAHTVLVS